MNRIKKMITIAVRTPSFLVSVLLCATLAVFALLKSQVGLMDFWVNDITTPYKQTVAWLCSFIPVSMAEVAWVVFILGCIIYVVRAAYLIARIPKEKRAYAIWRKSCGALNIGLSVWLAFTLLWGTNYYTTPFEAKIGITTQPIALEQLQAVTELFVEKLNERADTVARDENMCFVADIDTLFAQSATLYQPIEEQYPCLVAPPLPAKQMFFSHFMSTINYTGFFFPYTGEANLNVDAPVSFLPSTIAHELAHVRNIAPEQTANFVAVLACEASGIPEYEYSGALLAYLHLSNALYSADYDAWHAVYQTLSPSVQADLAQNNAYCQSFENVVADTVDTVYDGVLKSYDQTLGMKSYGAVVDLLVAYYG